jgi:hypothetical protein
MPAAIAPAPIEKQSNQQITRNSYGFHRLVHNPGLRSFYAVFDKKSGGAA